MAAPVMRPARTWPAVRVPLLSGRWQGLRTDQLVFAVTCVVVGLIVLPPVVTLVRTSFLAGAGPGRSGTLSLSPYVEIVASPDFLGLLASTLLFAAGSTVVGLVLGALLAWCIERTNTPLKSLAYIGCFVSFAMPGVLRVIGWIFLLGPRTGTLNVLARSLFHHSLLNAFSMPAMILIEGSFWIPVVFLLLGASFRAMDPALEEAAVLSGAPMVQTVRRVTLRLVLPGVLSALLLVFVRAIQAFEVPLLMGVPGNIYVLTSEVYISLQSRIVPEYSQPSAYGALLFALLIVCILVYSRVTSRASAYATVTGKGFRAQQLDLGRWRIATGAFVLAIVTIQFLPILDLVLTSFVPTEGLQGSLLSHMTTANYALVLGSSAILASLTNSFVIGCVSATAVAIIAAVVAWCIVRARVRARALLDQLASLPLVFGGVVLGLAVLVLYIGLPLPVYGTIWIFVIAYTIAFLPYGLRYVHPGLLQIGAELEESGSVSGARWRQVFGRIVIPLLLPALFAAWIFVFLISVRELAAAAMLYTAQTPVIATKMLDLWQNGNVNQASAFGAIISALSIAVALLAYRFVRRWGLRTG